MKRITKSNLILIFNSHFNFRFTVPIFAGEKLKILFNYNRQIFGEFFKLAEIEPMEIF